MFNDIAGDVVQGVAYLHIKEINGRDIEVVRVYPAQNEFADVPRPCANIGRQIQRDVGVEGWGYAVYGLVVNLAFSNSQAGRRQEQSEHTLPDK